MPLWELHCPRGALSLEDKRQLAVSITHLYTEPAGLPSSYVTVLFHELEPSSFFVGGEPRSNFVRIAVDHIARSFEQVGAHLGLPADTDWNELWRSMVVGALGPVFERLGLGWELHTDETPRSYWYIDGQIPPAAYSDEEAAWVRADHDLVRPATVAGVNGT